MNILVRLIVSISLIFPFCCTNGTGQDTTVPAKVLNVSAGPDDSVFQNEAVNLVGTFADSGKSDSPSTFTWRQVAGPAVSSIYDTASKITEVTFPRTGMYQFSFTVSCRNLIESDSVFYTVLDSVPFKILAPKEGDVVVIGDSTLISWQIVTPVQALVLLSINNGKSFNIQISPAGTSLKNLRQWMWKTDPALTRNDSCRVRIQDYNNKPYFAVSGRFSLKASN